MGKPIRLNEVSQDTGKRRWTCRKKSTAGEQASSHRAEFSRVMTLEETQHSHSAVQFVVKSLTTVPLL